MLGRLRPPDNQDESRPYMDQQTTDIHVGSWAQLRIYHEGIITQTIPDLGPESLQLAPFYDID